MKRSAAVVPPDSPIGRRAKTVPAACTPRLLAMLEAYLVGKPNRKRSARILLGCSDRTAGRLTSRRRKYVAPMKQTWAERICHACGKSLDDILGVRKPKTWQQSVLGWSDARNATEALQMATDCALSIVYRGLSRYELSGSFTLNFSGGYPREVVVCLSAAPEVGILGRQYALHQLIITTEVVPLTQRKRMVLKHVWPGAVAADKDILTADLVDKTLARVKDQTKHIVNQFQKEMTHGSTSSRR